MGECLYQLSPHLATAETAMLHKPYRPWGIVLDKQASRKTNVRAPVVHQAQPSTERQFLQHQLAEERLMLSITRGKM